MQGVQSSGGVVLRVGVVDMEGVHAGGGVVLGVVVTDMQGVHAGGAGRWRGSTWGRGGRQGGCLWWRSRREQDEYEKPASGDRGETVEIMYQED